jgi:hypothetical protein
MRLVWLAKHIYKMAVQPRCKALQLFEGRLVLPLQPPYLHRF